MKQINWFERSFDSVSNEHIFPSLLERLAGTPVRIKEKLKGINKQFYTIKVDNKWSIQEHVGHLERVWD